MIIKTNSFSDVKCWSRRSVKSASWSSGTTLLRSWVHPWFMFYGSYCSYFRCNSRSKCWSRGI